MIICMKKVVKAEVMLDTESERSPFYFSFFWFHAPWDIPNKAALYSPGFLNVTYFLWLHFCQTHKHTPTEATWEPGRLDVGFSGAVPTQSRHRGQTLRTSSLYHNVFFYLYSPFKFPADLQTVLPCRFDTACILKYYGSQWTKQRKVKHIVAFNHSFSS